MFTFRKKNETGLSDEEKKMAQELNEAIAKAEADKADRDEDSIITLALIMRNCVQARKTGM